MNEARGADWDDGIGGLFICELTWLIPESYRALAETRKIEAAER